MTAVLPEQSPAEAVLQQRCTRKVFRTRFRGRNGTGVMTNAEAYCDDHLRG